ncbi:Down syndrome cell adhesion molecule-like [Anoplophora glabripennis]|uniref:Down syndrome cell adhesion molecule-like n=1 Tax=Anoplophora glabripennis TaxID=217634 RepID=UPI000874EE66|nr:Down syndrome cell adhesion molecule-like [Anoplophora glabripennis]
MAVTVLPLNCMTVCVMVLFLIDSISLVTSEGTPTDISMYPEIIRSRRSYEVRRKDHSTGNSLKTPGHSTAFLTENSTVVVAQIGGTAKLPCVVRKFSNGVVSWIRKKDSPPTILTVGVGTYIADDRFLVEHARHLQNWGLVIKHVRPSDAGLYECQVSSHPTTSIFIELRVTEASAEIMGSPDLHVRAGSLLRLVCTLRHSTEPPEYVFWYHEQRMINHDPGVSVTADRASSVLQLEEADTSHNGNYTCYPSNAIPAYINVHVLNATEEENPAAMLHANSSDVSTALFISILLALFANILMTLDR